VLRGRGARSDESRSSPRFARAHGGGTHPGLRRNAPPFAGRCGSRRPQRWLASRSRGALHPVRAQRTGGSASRSSARATKGVCGTWIEEGLRPPKRRREPSLGWVRSMRGHVSSESRFLARLVSPDAPPQGDGRRAKVGRETSALLAERGREAARGRCPCLVVLQKSVEHPRAQRSAPPVAIGSKARSLYGAREREPDRRGHSNRVSGRDVRRQKGGGSAKSGDPHHVSVASSREATRARSCFGASAPRESSYRRKTSRIGKAHAFHEAPAEPVLAASEPTLGARRNAGPGEREGGGDRDVRGGRVSGSIRGR